MTTVAASRTEMAMAGDTLADNEGIACPALKVYRRRGALIGFAGDYYAGHVFLEWFERGAKRKDRPGIGEVGDFSGIVLDHEGNLFTCDSHCLLVPEPMDYFAIGSGAAFALSAMDLGLSVEKAVAHAIKFDPYSGGRVTIERLDL